MYKAVNCQGESIHVLDAVEREEYFCPICQQKVIIKRPTKKRTHFSHHPNKNLYPPCSDKWKYSDSEWRAEWMDQFPRETIERVVSYNGEKHLADVLIENDQGKKCVIEFSDSAYSYADLEERHSFFIKSGYKVIWVFDCRKNEFRWYSTNEPEMHLIVWPRHNKFFDNKSLKKESDSQSAYLDLNSSPESSSPGLKKVIERKTLSDFVLARKLSREEFVAAAFFGSFKKNQ